MFLIWASTITLQIYIKYTNNFGGACGFMIIVIRNRHNKLNSIPGWDCISYSANTLGKSMNPTILPPAMGK